MFSAHREIEMYDPNNAVKKKYYLSDTPATLIGCTEQVNSWRDGSEQSNYW